MAKKLIFLLGCIFVYSCSKDHKALVVRYNGDAYYNNEFKEKDRFSLWVECENLSQGDTIKKKYLITGRSGGVRIYILWKERSDNKVFLELNPRKLYHFNLKAYVSSVQRYFLDSTYLNKTWETFEDPFYDTFFDEKAEFGMDLIKVTLTKIEMKDQKRYYYFSQRMDADGHDFEDYVIDEELNIIQFANRTYRGHEIRYRPERTP